MEGIIEEIIEDAAINQNTDTVMGLIELLKNDAEPFYQKYEKILSSKTFDEQVTNARNAWNAIQELGPDAPSRYLEEQAAKLIVSAVTALKILRAEFEKKRKISDADSLANFNLIP